MRVATSGSTHTTPCAPRGCLGCSRQGTSLGGHEQALRGLRPCLQADEQACCDSSNPATAPVMSGRDARSVATSLISVGPDQGKTDDDRFLITVIPPLIRVVLTCCFQSLCPYSYFKQPLGRSKVSYGKHNGEGTAWVGTCAPKFLSRKQRGWVLARAGWTQVLEQAERSSALAPWSAGKTGMLPA